MKFVIAAVVVLAVAMGVQSSLIAGVPGLGLGINGLGLGLNGHGLGINGLGWAGHGLGGIVGPLGLQGPILAQNPGWWGAPAAINIAGAHLASPAHIPAAVNIASGPISGVAVAQQAALAGHGAGLIGHGATYVAKTRGAIHTAPLAGHINSAASINVAPAPGTW